MAHSPFSLSDFKSQALRLEEFLLAGGVQIKHTNALEAVARMHGAKDWQTLAAIASANAAGLAGAPPASYVVVSLYSNVTKTSVSSDRAIAIRDFLQTARMIVGVFGEDAKQIEVLGQDLDDGLPKLSLIIDDVVYCTLQQPSSPSTERVVGKRLVPGAVPPLTGIDGAEGYFEIAEAVSAAFNSVSSAEKRDVQEQLRLSLAVRMFSMDFSEVARALADETKSERTPPSIQTDPKVLMKDIEAIKMMHGYVATVQPEGVRLT